QEVNFGIPRTVVELDIDLPLLELQFRLELQHLPVFHGDGLFEVFDVRTPRDLDAVLPWLQIIDFLRQSADLFAVYGQGQARRLGNYLETSAATVRDEFDVDSLLLSSDYFVGFASHLCIALSGGFDDV